MLNRHVMAEKAFIFLSCEWIKVTPNFKTKLAGKISAAAVRKLQLFIRSKQDMDPIYRARTTMKYSHQPLPDNFHYSFASSQADRKWNPVTSSFFHQWWVQRSRLKGGHVTISEARWKQWIGLFGPGYIWNQVSEGKVTASS